jgi:hypothetical protein
VTDAVVVGTLLNSLLRHGDRVKIANQAQLVNVIAPIRSEEGGPAWRQSIFWPFARMAQLATGRILRVEVDSDRYDNDRFGTADVVDVSATWDEEAGTVSLFLANRGLEEEAATEVALRGLDAGRILRAEVLRVPEGGDRHSSNTLETGEQVGLVPLEGVHAEGGRLTLTLMQGGPSVVVGSGWDQLTGPSVRVTVPVFSPPAAVVQPSFTDSPGLWPEMAALSSDAEATAFPSTEVTTSPWARPALAAPDPSTTPCTGAPATEPAPFASSTPRKAG